MSRARFVSSSPALCYDAKNDTVIKVVRAVDDQGREWESWNDGPYVLVEMPDEPDPLANG